MLVVRLEARLLEKYSNSNLANLFLVDVNENALYMLERDLDFEKSHSKEYEDINYISEIVSIREKAAFS